MQLDGTTPLWIAARGLLYERGEELFRYRDKVIKTLDPEDIHDLRVASRRLREGLALFAPCYSMENIDRIDKKVKKVTRFLGDIRNTDEAILFFTALADELDDACRSDLEPLLASCRNERKREVRGLKNGLQKVAARGLRDLYLRTIHALPLFTPPGNGIDLFAPLSGFAKDALDSRLSVIRELLPQARENGAIEAQHRLRIAVKHFRYRMELLSFLLGADFPRLHAAVKGYQDVLGTMHDLDVFGGIVREAGFPLLTERLVLDSIGAKRAKLFRDFSGMLETTPIDTIGGQVRDAL
jgi:CHAD domain-containing protein